MEQKKKPKTLLFTGHLRVLLSSAEHDSSSLKDLSGFQLHYRLMNEKTGPKILHKYSFTMASLPFPASSVRDADGAKRQLGSVSRRPPASAGTAMVPSSPARTVFHQRDLPKWKPKGRRQEAIPFVLFGQSVFFKTPAKAAQQYAQSSFLPRKAGHVPQLNPPSIFMETDRPK